MKNDDDELARRPSVEPGQPLDLLSVDEIDARIEALKAEIVRLQEGRAAKLAASAAADAFFRK